MDSVPLPGDMPEEAKEWIRQMLPGALHGMAEPVTEQNIQSVLADLDQQLAAFERNGADAFSLQQLRAMLMKSSSHELQPSDVVARFQREVEHYSREDQPLEYVDALLSLASALLHAGEKIAAQQRIDELEQVLAATRPEQIAVQLPPGMPAIFTPADMLQMRRQSLEQLKAYAASV